MATHHINRKNTYFDCAVVETFSICSTTSPLFVVFFNFWFLYFHSKPVISGHFWAHTGHWFILSFNSMKNDAALVFSITSSYKMNSSSILFPSQTHRRNRSHKIPSWHWYHNIVYFVLTQLQSQFRSTSHIQTHIFCVWFRINIDALNILLYLCPITTLRSLVSLSLWWRCVAHTCCVPKMAWTNNKNKRLLSWGGWSLVDAIKTCLFRVCLVRGPAKILSENVMKDDAGRMWIVNWFGHRIVMS